ncbi:MAG TPA: SH3 domain-containing protein [Leptospiraceae bacterium]|nr:SH3 domain-containing protein [Leptospiraceae bacterium]HMY66757.1 SH3 domain-containing protein [Leptospiraceae bacterium]HNF15408.1 SH3 domain-containing protein [Leptospiraceae bacterium]HNF27703.1 SH3 domain-containing protein [Leptospiraceae bacterium]HNI94768.1 SH3 domain-containing protein [Leptospiraceae bacterium]
MKSKRCFIALSICILFIQCHQKTEIQKQSEKLFVVSTDGLILREKPSKDSKKILLIPFGAETELMENSEELDYIDGFFANWNKIKYNDKEGYAFSAYLTRDLNEYRNLQKKTWKELEELAKPLFHTDPEKSSHLYSLAYLKRNGGYGCFRTIISDMHKCIEQCIKVAEPIYCRNFQKVFHKENFQDTATFLRKQMENGSISEIIPYLFSCIQGQRICYHCDEFGMTSSESKLRLIAVQRDKIDFYLTKINTPEKTIEFFPKKNSEKGLYEKYMGRTDDYMQEVPFLKFTFLKNAKQDEDWKIQDIDGRILILNPVKFCYFGA